MPPFDITAAGSRLIRDRMGVASDRVYISSFVAERQVSSYLAFPSLSAIFSEKILSLKGYLLKKKRKKFRRSISVALSRKSPSADVIRYPAL